MFPWKAIVYNLIKWKRIIVDWCQMSKRNDEPVNHLLLHRSIAKELLAFIFVVFGVRWIMPKLVFQYGCRKPALYKMLKTKSGIWFQHLSRGKYGIKEMDGHLSGRSFLLTELSPDLSKLDGSSILNIQDFWIIYWKKTRTFLFFVFFFWVSFIYNLYTKVSLFVYLLMKFIYLYKIIRG